MTAAVMQHGRIPDASIELAKANIVGTISKYIDLKKAGKDYAACCPFHSEKTPSFTVSEAKGIYHCFGCGSGGDAIDFVMEHEGITFHEAVQSIVGNMQASGSAPQKRQVGKQEAIEEWKPVTPVPDSAGEPPDVFNRRNGDAWEKLTASRRWAYRDANGNLTGFVCRFELPGGGKDVLPQSFCVNSQTGEMRWKWLSFAKPRQIFGLEKLAKYPKAQVVIVEGEKACEAAQALFEALGISRDKLVTVSWPGGGKAIKHVDWSPLVGRNVGLWPDADRKSYIDSHARAGDLMPFIEQPGTVCMVDIANRLEGVADAIKFITPPSGVPDGWDLGDPLPEGLNLLAYMKLAAKPMQEFRAMHGLDPAPTATPVPTIDVSEQHAVVDALVVMDETTSGFDELMQSISGARTKDELVALAGKVRAQRLDVADQAIVTSEFINAFKLTTGASLTKGEAKEMLAPRKGEKRQAKEDERETDGEAESPIEGHFRVLGFDRKTMFIYSFEKKQVLEYSARDMTDNGLLELAPASWWEANFPGSGDGIDRKKAANAIIRLANGRGIYDQSLVRGRGAWWDTDRLVVHLGDRLLIDGAETGLAEIASSRYVYEQSAPLADIVSDALTDDEGRKINEIARMFRWERSVSADMLAGWLFLAPICGALKWRPHIWITGGAGSGKTTVLEHFVCRLLPESMPIFSNGDSSEAGLRQELASEARPLLVDETEADSDRAKSRIEAVLGMLRQSSSDTTSKTYRGTVGGKSQSFSLRTMACMASIGVALRQQQDFERIEVLALRPKRSDHPETEWETIKEQLKWVARDRNIGSRMLRRAINMADVIVATVDVFAAAVAVTLGTQRNGDQVGALLAGAWCLQNSRAPSFDEAEAVLGSICWDDFRANHQEEGVDLVATLLGCPVILEGGVRTTIGLLIECAAGRDAEGLESMDPKTANTSLGLYGLKVVADDLRVHTKNAELERLLGGTRFRNGLHERMRRIEGANTMSGKPFRIGGVSTNGLEIPLSSITQSASEDVPKDSAPSATYNPHVPEEHPTH